MADPEEAPRTLARLSPAVLCVAVLVAGVGRSAPALVEILGAVALASLVLFARDRVRRGPRLSFAKTALGVLVGLALALSVATGGHGARVAPDLEALCGRMSVALALLAGVGVALPYALPWLLQPIANPRPRSAAPVPDGRVGLALVALSWLAFHGAIFAAFPPLIWCDSWVNLWEPRLFHVSDKHYLHTPLYAEIVRVLGEGPHFIGWLTCIVVVQHLAVLGLGVALERLVRRETGSRLAGALAGLIVVLDGFFAMFAQRIATEVPGTTLYVAAVALLVEATWRARAERWLLAAGALVATATLTRPVFQAWFLVGVFWLLVVRPMSPRWRAAALFAFGALMPIFLLKVHNHVFLGDARLTGQTGKALVYRIVTDMPPLTDPDAAPDDEMERARRLTWAKRDEVWMGPWAALEEELGWTDARIDRAMQRFYFEQIARHPRAFAETTVAYVGSILTAHATFEEVVQSHNTDRERAFFGWDAIPPSPRPPPTIESFSALRLTSRLGVLILAALAPLVVTGERRRTALLLLASAAYAVVLPALVLGPERRTRLPAMPFIAAAFAMAVAGLIEHVRRAPPPSAPPPSAPPPSAPPPSAPPPSAKDAAP